MPKVLVPVAGRPMLEHLLRLYRHHVVGTVVVVNPAALAAVRAYCETQDVDVVTAVQPHPTGMLDAILAAGPEVRALRPDRVWITWCDQLAIRPATLARLAAMEADHGDAAILLPTSHRPEPYIHFARDASGRIAGVLQRREGDAMPPEGESDAGLFSLSAAAFEALDTFDAGTAAGAGTAERNFLPFIPWMAQRDQVLTFPCTNPFEAVGINTPDDLRQVERYLSGAGDA